MGDGDLQRRIWEMGRADVFSIRASEAKSGVSRLEAAFYGSDGYRAVQQLSRSGFELRTVGELSDVLWLGPSARIYVDGPKHGVPFMSSAEMLEARLLPDHFVSRALTHNLAHMLVRDGQILVSRSGTIGSIALCTEQFTGFAVSEHAIRVSPRETALRAIIYCMLVSDAGQFLLKRSKSGSVIDSIYAEDVEAIPVPWLPAALRNELSRLVVDATRLRVSADRLLNDADEAVQRACYLPDVSSLSSPQIMGDTGSATAFTAKASESVFANKEEYGLCRLDASFHNPVAVKLAGLIRKHELGTTLGAITKSIRRIAPGKRTYSETADRGIPLIGGKQMMQIAPRDLKYLSRVMTVRNALELLIDGTTLIASGGTIGRTMFVHRNFEHATASEDVMRVFPDEAKVAPGFIYAFLASGYGQIQLAQRSFGSVVPRLRQLHFPSIAVRVPRDKGEAIHDTVLKAFDFRADARAKEEAAFRLFGSALNNGRAYVESEWGKEY